MHDRRPLGADRVDVDVDETALDTVAEHLRDVVLGVQTVEEAAHRRRAGVVRGVHTREQRVPTQCRELDGAQDGPHWRRRHVRVVDVPAVGAVALRVHLVEDHDLGHRRGRGEERRDADGPEPRCEPQLFLGIDRLIAEEQHEVLEQRGAHRTDGRVVEIPTQVDAGDLGADRRGERRDRQPHMDVTR
jgi:hypothetical protein